MRASNGRKGSEVFVGADIQSSIVGSWAAGDPAYRILKDATSAAQFSDVIGLRAHFCITAEH
jgi:hypothetical protein